MSARDECGTYAGVGAHRRADEDPCDDCKRANALYMQRWRKRRPDLAADNAAADAARDRALRRLGHQYPNDLARLHAEELAAMRQDRAS